MLRVSITSISPARGQPTCSRESPSSQNAGWSPWPDGSEIRAEIVPYRSEYLPRVVRRADVMVPESRRAVIRRCPLPSSLTLRVLSV
ncbi:Uncharacterised protein [Mycobacteroides abscessus subsp. abscessus]|nr:Uncharacterised protein [Mycobacteroides abscessus subsp. abscessus]